MSDYVEMKDWFLSFWNALPKRHLFTFSSHKHTFKQKIRFLKEQFGRMLDAISKNTPTSTCILSLLGFIGNRSW